MEGPMDYKYAEIEEYFDDWLQDTLKHQGLGWVQDNMDDLHHHAFNTDYYIIGTERAINWMGSYSWDIINYIKEYEQDNFGECTTDLSDPEKVVNMYVYIIGEQVVAEYRNEQEAA
tara:strand:+ start:159 stop:506 length:348 start_codon:yes stop_codon:yes gene_type:complete